MAVAEKTTEKTKATSPTQSFAVSTLLGGVFILVALSVIFAGLPLLWMSDVGPDQLLNPYLSTALVFGLGVVTAVVFAYLGGRLERMHPLRGQRMGAVLFAVGALVIGLITLELANWGARQEMEAAATYLMAGGVGGVLLVILVALYFRPAAQNWLVRREEEGWVHATAFKPTQGTKVRRGTLVALLVTVGAGVWTAMQNRFFVAAADPGAVSAWTLPVPFTDYAVYLLFRPEYLGPLLAFAVFGWLAWRTVNLPPFADFLIATEAEMNKVSWTTRKRLVQDTIVVLVTVALLTAFLFAVDILWVKLLSSPFPGVLQFNPTEAKAKQLAPTEW